MVSELLGTAAAPAARGAPSGAFSAGEGEQPAPMPITHCSPSDDLWAPPSSWAPWALGSFDIQPPESGHCQHGCHELLLKEGFVWGSVCLDLSPHPTLQSIVTPFPVYSGTQWSPCAPRPGEPELSRGGLGRGWGARGCHQSIRGSSGRVTTLLGTLRVT